MPAAGAQGSSHRAVSTCWWSHTSGFCCYGLGDHVSDQRNGRVLLLPVKRQHGSSPAQRSIVKALPIFPSRDTCLTYRHLFAHKWQEFINSMTSSRAKSVFGQGRKRDALLVLLRKANCPNPLPCCCSLLRCVHQLLIKAQLWANQGTLKTSLLWI